MTRKKGRAMRIWRRGRGKGRGTQGRAGRKSPAGDTWEQRERKGVRERRRRKEGARVGVMSSPLYTPQHLART